MSSFDYSAVENLIGFLEQHVPDDLRADVIPLVHSVLANGLNIVPAEPIDAKNLSQALEAALGATADKIEFWPASQLHLRLCIEYERTEGGAIAALEQRSVRAVLRSRYDGLSADPLFMEVYLHMSRTSRELMRHVSSTIESSIGHDLRSEAYAARELGTLAVFESCKQCLLLTAYFAAAAQHERAVRMARLLAAFRANPVLCEGHGRSGTWIALEPGLGPLV